MSLMQALPIDSPFLSKIFVILHTSVKRTFFITVTCGGSTT
jgi:hypothetical protein